MGGPGCVSLSSIQGGEGLHCTVFEAFSDGEREILGICGDA